MPDTFYDEKSKERRRFPRIKAQGPVNYFTRTTGNWSKAQLEDYSAGGICFVCDETLLRDTKITVQVSDGANKEIPAIAASAIVVRCEVDDDQQFRIACKFTQIMQGHISKLSRFSRR